MRRPALFAFILAGLAACDTLPSAPRPPEPSSVGPALALVENEHTYDVELVGLFNPCPPEEFIAATANIHVVVTEGENSTRVRLNASDVHGIGLTSGDRYTAHSNRKTDVTVSGGTETVDFVDHFRIIRQGSADNYDFFAVFRFTFPPVGDPTVELIRLHSDECRG